MFKHIPIRSLICLLITLPITVSAQTCKPDSILASTPTAQFTVHDDGTVTDTKTGLMWKTCAEGQSGATCANGGIASYTWQQALSQVQTVNSTGGFATYVDWRLPNIKELDSIAERQCDAPAINLTVFPNTPADIFWSSSAAAYNGFYAWNVDFNRGNSDSVGKYRLDKHYVRCVRGGR